MGGKRSLLLRLGGFFCLSIIIAFLAYALPRFSPKFFAFEHKYSDWRTVFLSEQKPTQDDRILIVKITEEDLAGLKYRSPVDREFLANLIQTIDANDPKVFGIDLLFDQPTEETKDNLIFDALKNSSSPIVLASVNERYPATKDQRAYMQSVYDQTELQTGLINLVSDIDGVIRRLPADLSGDAGQTLSAQLARSSGAKFKTDVSYWEQISWLKKPKDQTDIFLETSAGFYLKNPELARTWTKGKIVILGAELLDSDNHRTPFTILGRQMKLTSGVHIHAQLTAQRLDSRRIILLPRLFEFFAYFFAAFSAFELFRRFNKVPRLAKVSGYLGIGLVVLDGFFFKFFSIILPTAMIVLCFSSVITFCFLARKMAKKKLKTS